MYTAQDLYGASPQMAALTSAAPLHQAGGGDMGSGWKMLVNPRNPLVVFGLLLALTVGAAGVAGSARVGSIKVSGSAGKA